MEILGLPVKQVVGTVLRGTIQGAAGVLVAKGILTAEAAGPFVEVAITLGAGIVTYVATLIWSAISKKKALDTIPNKA
jgi:hypothetical protein